MTHVFRERRVAAAEHENARRLVREGGAKEVRDVLVTLEPVKRRLCFPSYARGDLYDPHGSRKKSALTVHISGPYYEDRLKQNRDQGSVRGAHQYSLVAYSSFLSGSKSLAAIVVVVIVATRGRLQQRARRPEVTERKRHLP
jgi:hypothetical protein